MKTYTIYVLGRGVMTDGMSAR